MGNNMIDFVIAVDDPPTWHTMNLMQNRKHYSLLRFLGPKQVSSMQMNYGAGVYYNTLVPCDGRIDKSPEGQFVQLMGLPRTLQQQITRIVDPPGKNRDVEEMLLQVAQDPDCGLVVQQGISAIVKSSSITQSAKGILTAGLLKTVSYSMKKLQKMWKGSRRKSH
ncbi:UNVERIFIED_CONTAM: hypothetical protein FKN15_068310 [Acipenser sinensis]